MNGRNITVLIAALIVAIVAINAWLFRYDITPGPRGGAITTRYDRWTGNIEYHFPADPPGYWHSFE